MQGVKIVKKAFKIGDGFDAATDTFEDKINAEIERLRTEGKKVFNVSICYDRGITYLASILWEKV